MAATTKAAGRTSKVAPEEDIDLLSGMDTDIPQAPADDDDDFDLLSEMSESEATAWMPWDEEEQPNGIQGTVVHIGTVTQDARYGGDDVPYWEMRDKGNPDLTWGIRGYATVLKNQMEKAQDAGLRTGDFAAVVYQGVKSNRKGDNEYKAFQVRARHIGH